MLPKHIDTAIRVVVNAKGFLVCPFKKLNILGSISSSAIELMIFGAF